MIIIHCGEHLQGLCFGNLSPSSDKHPNAQFVPFLVTRLIYLFPRCILGQQLSHRLTERLSSVPSWSTCQLCFLLNATSGSKPSSVFRGLDTLLLFLSPLNPPPSPQGTAYYKTVIASSSTGCWLCNTNTGCYHNGSDPARVALTAPVIQPAWPAEPRSASMFVPPPQGSSSAPAVATPAANTRPRLRLLLPVERHFHSQMLSVKRCAYLVISNSCGWLTPNMHEWTRHLQLYDKLCKVNSLLVF